MELQTCAYTPEEAEDAVILLGSTDLKRRQRVEGRRLIKPRPLRKL